MIKIAQYYSKEKINVFDNILIDSQLIIETKYLNYKTYIYHEIQAISL